MVDICVRCQILKGSDDPHYHDPIENGLPHSCYYCGSTVNLGTCSLCHDCGGLIEDGQCLSCERMCPDE